MIWYYSKKSTQAPGLGQERQQTDRRRFGTLWQQQPAGKRPKGRQRLPGHGPGWEECHCVPWRSALLRRQMQQADRPFWSKLFSPGPVRRSWPVALRMTTWSNACRLQHRQLQHSRAAFSGSDFCRLALHKKTCTYGQNLA